MRFKQPADAARARRARHRARRPATCRSGSAATWRCSRRSARCCSPRTRPARCSTSDFIERLHRRASRSGASTCAPLDWDEVLAATGLSPRRRSTSAAAMLRRLASAPIICWAMGLTQHRNAVATIREIVNVAARCRATSASPAPACARSAATPTCRATARWASGSSRRRTSSTRCSAEFGFDAAARARPRHRRRHPGAARRRGEGVLRRWAATSSRPRPTPR